MMQFDSAGSPVSGFFQSPTTSIPAAISFAYNYQGLGLPITYYNDVVSLLKKISSIIYTDLTCENAIQGSCFLKNNCEYYAANSNLWDF